MHIYVDYADDKSDGTAGMCATELRASCIMIHSDLASYSGLGNILPGACGTSGESRVWRTQQIY